MQALSASTDVVTLTVGGNDVGFESYILGCSAALCGPGTGDYQNAMSNIDDPAFTSHLESAYRAIVSKAPNADVYVADYPYMAPENAQTQSCGVIDVSGIYNLTTELDGKIKSVVNVVAADHPKLHFVEVNYDQSPFTGKYVCSSDPDFNSLESHTDPGGSGITTSYSFHPNAAGQSAYATVFGDAIGSN